MSRTIQLLDTSTQFSRITLKHIILSNSNVHLFKPSNLITIRSMHTKLSNQNSKRYYNYNYNCNCNCNSSHGSSSFHKPKQHQRVSLSQPSLNYHHHSNKQKPKLIFHNTELVRLMTKAKTKQQQQQQQRSSSTKYMGVRNKVNAQQKLLTKGLTERTKCIKVCDSNSNVVDTNKSCISFNAVGCVDDKECCYKKICGVFLKGRNGRKRSVINQRKMHMEQYESQMNLNERTMALPVINLLKMK